MPQEEKFKESMLGINRERQGSGRAEVCQSTWCSFWQPKENGDRTDGKEGRLLESLRRGVSGGEPGKKINFFPFRLFPAVHFFHSVQNLWLTEM